MSVKATATTTSVILRKRKRSERALSLHLSGGSRSSLSPARSLSYVPTASEYDDNVESEVTCDEGFIPTIRNTQSRNNEAGPSEPRRYRCTTEGCNKSYKRPSRLEEHMRTHTGERPFTCPTCSKSFLRNSHLQSHARSHLPETAKEYSCDFDWCGKRFWTAQHLEVHENVHSGDKPFKCTQEGCPLAFSKHNKLRAHISSAHSPPGTKSFKCEHDDCAKSFSTGQKLKAHTKTHDEKRYTCVHASCVSLPDTLYFATWSALQAHTRIAHPAQCPYPECNGRAFNARGNLRAHLKVHEQREVEIELAIDAREDLDDEEERGRKRRRGGEIGRDWKCEAEDCGKDFKSKKAMSVHYNVTHLGRRDFVCPTLGCRRAFGYKHLLQRHSEKHSASPQHDETGEPTRVIGASSVEEDTASSYIDMITGKLYETNKAQLVESRKGICCPFPDVPSSFRTPPDAVAEATPPTPRSCEYVFTRAYDLRRHLRVVHQLAVEKDVIDRWVKDQKHGQNLPAATQ